MKITTFDIIKYIKRVLVIILIIILTHLILWQINNFKYKSYMNENYESQGSGSLYLYKINQIYNVYVAFPQYPYFQGNLGVSESNAPDNLIIWPDFFHQTFTYGYAYEDSQGRNLWIKISKQGDIVDNIFTNEITQEFNELHKDRVKFLMDIAEEYWNLNE